MLQKIKLKYCSLFPSIDYTEDNLYCSLRPLQTKPEITKNQIVGYLRKYKRFQTSHTIMAAAERRYEFRIYHNESVDVALFMLADTVLITDDNYKDIIFENIDHEETIYDAETYVSIFTGSVFERKSELSNLESVFLYERGVDNSALVPNVITIVNNKPSYNVIIPTYSVTAGNKLTFTLTLSLYPTVSNIAVNDYLYCHAATVSTYLIGFDVVKCTVKTATEITFEGQTDADNTYSGTNLAVLIDYEISFLVNANVVARSLTTYIYTDFEGKKSNEIESAGGEIELALAKKFNVKKTIIEKIEVPFVLKYSEFWKASEVFIADTLTFADNSGTYRAFEIFDNLREVTIDSVRGYKQYILTLIVAKKVVNLNK